MLKYLKYMYAHDTDICIFQDIKGGTKIINSAGKEIEKTIQDSLLATAFRVGRYNLFNIYSLIIQCRLKTTE